MYPRTMLKSSGTVRTSQGHLTIFYGSMFAEKTSTMTNAVERHHLAKRRCLIVKHGIDNRYDHLAKNGGIVTHAGYEHSVVKVVQTHKLSDIDVAEYDVIGVDELQFFDDMELVDAWADQGKIVYAAALDGNFLTQPFESPTTRKRVTDLIASSDDSFKLHAVCMRCGDDASFTVRTGGPISGTVDVGGKDKYIAVCRKCKKAIKTVAV